MRSLPWSKQELVLIENNMHRGVEFVFNLLSAKGFNRTPEAVGRQIRRLRFKLKLKRDAQVGHLDIEATNLNAPWGHLLTYCIRSDRNNTRVEPGKIFKDQIHRSDVINYRGDYKLIKSLVQNLSRFDHITTYYGKLNKPGRYDLAMIFSKALKYGLPFPRYGELTQIDLYDVCRSRFKLHNNRLATVAEYLGIKDFKDPFTGYKVEKTPIETEDWRKGALGHVPSLRNIMWHNIGDVLVLEEVYHRLKDYHADSRTPV